MVILITTFARNVILFLRINGKGKMGKMGTDLFFKFGDRMIFSQTDAKKNSVPSVRNFGEE